MLREIGRVTLVEALQLTALIVVKDPRQHARVSAGRSSPARAVDCAGSDRRLSDPVQGLKKTAACSPVSNDGRNSGDARSSAKNDQRVRHVEHAPFWPRSARNRARAARRLAKFGAAPWWA